MLDERKKALMVVELSLDRQFLIIRNEGRSIARGVSLEVEGDNSQQALISDEMITKASIGYMPLAEYKLPIIAEATGYFKIRISWDDDFKNANSETYRVKR